jgi:hypothetical protein
MEMLDGFGCVGLSEVIAPLRRFPLIVKRLQRWEGRRLAPTSARPCGGQAHWTFSVRHPQRRNAQKRASVVSVFCNPQLSYTVTCIRTVTIIFRLWLRYTGLACTRRRLHVVLEPEIVSAGSVSSPQVLGCKRPERVETERHEAPHLGTTKPPQSDVDDQCDSSDVVWHHEVGDDE